MNWAEQKVLKVLVFSECQVNQFEAATSRLMHFDRSILRNSEAFQELSSLAVDLLHVQCSLSLTYSLVCRVEVKSPFFRFLYHQLSRGSLAVFQLLALIHKGAKICSSYSIVLALLAM